MKHKISRESGFTLVEIMIVVAIIGLLAAIAIPNFVRARTSAQSNACVNNLRIIDGAKQQYALEQRVAITVTPTSSQLQVYLGHQTGGGLPTCPADTAKSFSTSYSVNTLNVPPTCQINAAHVLPN